MDEIINYLEFHCHDLFNLKDSIGMNDCMDIVFYIDSFYVPIIKKNHAII